VAERAAKRRGPRGPAGRRRPRSRRPRAVVVAASASATSPARETRPPSRSRPSRTASPRALVRVLGDAHARVRAASGGPPRRGSREPVLGEPRQQDAPADPEAGTPTRGAGRGQRAAGLGGGSGRLRGVVVEARERPARHAGEGRASAARAAARRPASRAGHAARHARAEGQVARREQAHPVREGARARSRQDLRRSGAPSSSIRVLFRIPWHCYDRAGRSDHPGGGVASETRLCVSPGKRDARPFSARPLRGRGHAARGPRAGAPPAAPASLARHALRADPAGARLALVAQLGADGRGRRGEAWRGGRGAAGLRLRGDGRRGPGR
jgi:hypothetical protein